MRTSNRTSRAARATAAQRDQLLAEFDRSDVSAAAFARKHQLNYTTFCGWRARRSKTSSSSAFVQVELTEPATAGALVVELGGHARLRIESGSQIALAAQLLHHLNACRPC